jgi:hypothetical protein
MPRYLREPVDDLPFGNEEKARRYASERDTGAVGHNWYACDPSLQFLMRRYLGSEDCGPRHIWSGSARSWAVRSPSGPN